MRLQHTELVVAVESAVPTQLAKLRPETEDSLTGWVRLYWQVRVAGGNPKTCKAKERDLERFVRFFGAELGHDSIDGWTSSISLQFQSTLLGQGLKATTINRVFATLRHFAAWVGEKRDFLAGSPFAGVRDIAVDAPDWRGLSDRELMRLRAAMDTRLHACRGKQHNPLLEATVFYVLLHTGLRVAELVALDFAQYHHRGFHDVARKGKRVQAKVPVPAEARGHLDRYIEEKRGDAPGPLFVSLAGNRLHTSSVAAICSRLAAQASVHGRLEEAMKLTPHMLRHSFLKRYADKHGVHAAQAASGNVSFREIFRYTKPSPDELEEQAAGLFGGL